MANGAAEFFEKYNSDPELQKEVAEAEMYYPGSLEVRESVVKNVLLPIAQKHGYDFTIKELRAYETKLKMQAFAWKEGDEPEPDDGEKHYWLLEHGWPQDAAKEAGEKYNK